MAKTNAEQEEPTPDFITPWDIKGGDPETVEDAAPAEPVPTSAERIAALWQDVGDIDGEPFDPTNEDHIIVASFLVGHRGILRKL